MIDTAITKIQQSNRMQRDERIHINANNGNVMLTLVAFKFIDKDTKQHIVYIPSLDISGYGDTEEKALDMAKFSIVDFCQYLFTLPANEMQIELSKFGWKETLIQKDFSRASVDGNGIFKGFNAENDKIERITLIAA